MSKRERDAQLDVLRGIAVVGMFFFSFVVTLSDDLPILLTHNVLGKLLPGDFVLSLFLFCSGLSLAMLQSRINSLGNWTALRKLSVRIGQMLVASVFITPFSVGEVLGMDEMMLNLVLTLPALLIFACKRVWIWGFALGILIVHTLLGVSGVLRPSPEAYLGGYPLAIFWLPIVLGGGLAWVHTVREVWTQALLWCGILCLALLFVGWPDKMGIHSTFGLLSIVISLILLGILRRYSLRCRWLEYMGSKPLRMWVLMFALLGPIRLYAEVELRRRSLPLSPLMACAGSFAWMWCCFMLSRGWDRIIARTKTS